MNTNTENQNHKQGRVMQKAKPLPSDIERRLRAFFSKSHFRNAVTYEKTAPHCYTVNPAQRGGDPGEFFWVVRVLRKYGYDKPFYSKVFRYLDLDGYSYWECGGPVEGCGVINRVPIK